PSPLPLPISAAYLLHPTSSDLEVLVDLMQAAYDLPDEALPALRLRLHNYFSAGDAHPLLDSSWMCFLDGRPISACLLAMPRDAQVPQLVDLMTVAPWQNHGLATVVLEKSLHALVENGFSSVQLTCYDADLPVIHKLEQFGFEQVEN
ncbi:GNAT family N-acetyltransferase, partial [bacterium]